jgi:hypothetical protein
MDTVEGLDQVCNNFGSLCILCSDIIPTEREKGQGSLGLQEGIADHDNSIISQTAIVKIEILELGTLFESIRKILIPCSKGIIR